MPFFSIIRSQFSALLIAQERVLRIVHQEHDGGLPREVRSGRYRKKEGKHLLSKVCFSRPYNCCFCLYCSIVLQPQLQVRVEQVRLLPPEDGARRRRRRRRRGQGMGLLQSVLLGGEPQHAAERHSIRNVKRDLQKVRDMDCLIPWKIPYGQSFAGTALIPCRARSSAPWGRCTRLTQCISGKEDREEKFLSTGITISVPHFSEDGAFKAEHQRKYTSYGYRDTCIGDSGGPLFTVISRRGVREGLGGNYNLPLNCLICGEICGNRL